jgi:hypothetical protein
VVMREGGNFFLGLMATEPYAFETRSYVWEPYESESSSVLPIRCNS